MNVKSTTSKSEKEGLIIKSKKVGARKILKGAVILSLILILKKYPVIKKCARDRS